MNAARATFCLQVTHELPGNPVPPTRFDARLDEVLQTIEPARVYLLDLDASSNQEITLPPATKWLVVQNRVGLHFDLQPTEEVLAGCRESPLRYSIDGGSPFEVPPFGKFNLLSLSGESHTIAVSAPHNPVEAKVIAIQG